jgi:hypothetical protein
MKPVRFSASLSLVVAIVTAPAAACGQSDPCLDQGKHIPFYKDASGNLANCMRYPQVVIVGSMSSSGDYLDPHVIVIRPGERVPVYQEVPFEQAVLGKPFTAISANAVCSAGINRSMLIAQSDFEDIEGLEKQEATLAADQNKDGSLYLMNREAYLEKAMADKISDVDLWRSQGDTGLANESETQALTYGAGALMAGAAQSEHREREHERVSQEEAAKYSELLQRSKRRVEQLRGAADMQRKMGEAQSEFYARLGISLAEFAQQPSDVTESSYSVHRICAGFRPRPYDYILLTSPTPQKHLVLPALATFSDGTEQVLTFRCAGPKAQECSEWSGALAWPQSVDRAELHITPARSSLAWTGVLELERSFVSETVKEELRSQKKIKKDLKQAKLGAKGADWNETVPTP